MASEEDWCAEKLSKLLQENLRITTLNEIKDHLSSLPASEAMSTAQILRLPLVFDCLNDSNAQQIDLACDVLSLCLNNLHIGESITKYDVPLERALSHPHSSVKIMALREIERSVSAVKPIEDLCKRTSLLCSIIRCIGDESIEVAREAVTIMCLIGGSSYGIKALVSSDLMEVMREVMDMNEVIRLRVYEIAIKVSKISEESLSQIKPTGLMQQILDELESRDVLLRLNIIEMLSDLGPFQHGFTFLEENKVFTKLLSIVENEDDPISCQLCEPGILKFFATFVHYKPLEMYSKYPKLFDRIFANLESSSLSIVGVSLDTLGLIGLTNEGKTTLHSTGNKITYAVKTIGRLLSSLPTEVRLRALKCIANLLKINDSSNEIMKVTRKWYTLLGDDPMEVILRYARNPFEDLRLAGLEILLVIAGQQWGQEEIRNTPGLIEFLLNRNVEVIKECKELKYEVVKALANSTTLDHPTLSKLQAFVKEGPFHVDTVTEIAFEGDD